MRPRVVLALVVALQLVAETALTPYWPLLLRTLFGVEELAATGTREFLFIAAPLRLRGGTGSPINPLAILTP